MSADLMSAGLLRTSTPRLSFSRLLLAGALALGTTAWTHSLPARAADEPAPGASSTPVSPPAAEPSPDSPAANNTPLATAPGAAKQIAPDPPGMTRLSPTQNVWLDKAKNRVVFDGAVCLREGFLEMFVCPRGTKEHESIIAVEVDAHIVHAGLLAIGAKPGKPAQWQPNYVAATGEPIDITLIWTDEKGVVHREAAQEWIRDNRTQKPLETTWVFAGSSMGIGGDGKPHYRADDGDFICVSNFPDAMLDLPVESSEANEQRSFEAFTEHIPPKGTRVRLVLTPRSEEPPKSR